MAPRHRSRPSSRGFSPQTDGIPHRPWSSVNVREHEKRAFDVLQTWWSLRDEAPISHWDGFSILLHHYLNTADIPDELATLLRR